MDLTSAAEGGIAITKEDILSQKVSGEFSIFAMYKNVFVKCLSFSADHLDQLILFRMCVSRKAAMKGRAVLEGVGLPTFAIDACFSSHPLDEEGAVQAGLTKWSGGQGLQPPTWQVLLGAMTYAQIAQEHVQELKDKLAQGMLLTI